MKNEKRHIGDCPVDSGQILITDPCYIEDKKTFKYKNIALLGNENVEMTSKSVINKEGIGLGVVFSTRIGDGVYPIYEIWKDGKLEKIEIQII